MEECEHRYELIDSNERNSESTAVQYNKYIASLVGMAVLFCWLCFQWHSHQQSQKIDCWLSHHAEFYPDLDEFTSLASFCNSALRLDKLCTMSEVFNLVGDSFDKHRLNWFPSHGSLIGAVRHGGFTPHDYDMDIKVVIQTTGDDERFYNAINELKEVANISVSNNGKLKRGSGWWWVAYILSKGIHLDINKLVILNDTLVLDGMQSYKQHKKVFYHPFDSIFPLSTCLYHGREVACPKDPVAYLVQVDGYHNIQRSTKQRETEIGKLASECLQNQKYTNVFSCENDHCSNQQFVPYPIFTHKGECCLDITDTPNAKYAGLVDTVCNKCLDRPIDSYLNLI